MAKYNVLQIAPTLDLGGTEKTLQLFAQNLNKELFNVSVCGWIAGGARAEQLINDGFKVFITNNDKDQLIQVMKDEQIHIVHVHRSGCGDDFVVEAAHKAGVPIIVETNVFGRVDETVWEPYIDYHLFVSKTCALRYRRWTGLSWEAFSQRHRVLYNPISLTEIDQNSLCLEGIELLRNGYSLPMGAPVIGGIGRPEPSKWPSPALLISILYELVKLVPGVKIVLMGAPQNIINSLSKTKLYDKVILLEPSPEAKKVFGFYSMIDVLIHLAKIGESFGLVIAEAMAIGKPVVTKSTPLHDNAQVELIDHGRNGYVAYDEKALAEATADLLLNKEKRYEMGSNARKKVEMCYDVNNVTKQLEGLYWELLEKKGIAVDSLILGQYRSLVPSPSETEVMNFEKEYQRRIRSCWGQPNWLEVLSFEYLLGSHLIYKTIRKTKKFLMRY